MILLLAIMESPYRAGTSSCSAGTHSVARPTFRILPRFNRGSLSAYHLLSLICKNGTDEDVCSVSSVKTLEEAKATPGVMYMRLPVTQFGTVRPHLHLSHIY